MSCARPLTYPPYRHHPVTSITRSALPAAKPNATVTFATGGEAGKRKLRLMILRYINAAMERAHYEIIEDAEPFYGSIPGIQGVWATGVTLEACRKELADSLEDWLLLSVRQGAGLPRGTDPKTAHPGLPGSLHRWPSRIHGAEGCPAHHPESAPKGGRRGPPGAHSS